ncbi:MAG: PCMD domain-containing protein [Bacteroidales bacterium]|nr:PCMD domain-containing protein [Bacteroidales bacterium]
MKKLLLSCAMACFAFAAGAQGIYQFAYPGFEGDWRSDEEPGNGWNSFPSAVGSMAGLGKGSSPKPQKVEGHNSSVAVKIFSKSILGKKANGNLTTGRINMGSMTPANSANYNYTDRSSSDNSLRFAGRPDAVSFYAKFTPGSDNADQKARGQFILHDDCDYRDPEIDSQSGNRVGKASVLIDASTEWTYYEGAFTYDKNSTPEVQYLLGSFTTNPTPGGSKGDELIIDDIHFIYYSTLGGVLYDPAAIDFKEDVLNYTVDAEYSAIDFYCTTKGKGATKELSYDENTGVLTVTVKGNDISVNPDNYTVYTFTFKTGGETPDPDPDPNPDPEPEVKPLGTPVATLAELSNTETYAVYNDTYTAYLIYSEANSTSKVWTAEMSGDGGDHKLSNSAYAGAFDVTAAAQSWMAIQYEGNFYLYNVGAQKFLTTPGYSGETGACTFSSSPMALQTTDLGNGWFAFSATGSEKDWVCAAPQLPNPISIWTTGDSGSRWQFRPNPNVEYDAQVIAKYFTPSGISAVSNDTVANAMIYDLSGREVGTLRKALPRGIYIQNNKKFFVK